MKSFRKLAVMLALLCAVTVQAQTPVPQPTPVSSAEMRVRLEAMKTEIDSDMRHVLHLQALARKNKDVIKLTCINDKLVQIKAQMNIFDSAHLQLEAAINAEEQRAQSVFGELEQAGADIKKLRGEADGCAGELEMYRQESDSDVDRPVLDDPTDGGPFTPPETVDTVPTDVEPPGYATPYR